MDDLLMQVSGVGIIITTIATIVFNGVVIIAYCLMAKELKQRAANIFLVNQAFADMSSIIPTVIWLLFAFGAGYHDLDRVYKSLFLYTSFVIIGSLIVTALDRFACVKFPLRHHKMGGICMVTIAVSIAWIMSVIPAALYMVFVIPDGDEFKFARVAFSILLLFVFVILIILLLTFMTLRSSIQRRIIDLSSLPLNERKNDELNEEQAKERRLIIILFSMVMAYATTILPHIIVVLLSLHQKELGLDHTFRYWQRITYLIYALSAAIDPLLTIFLRSDFKRARNWITLRRCCSESRQGELQHDGETVVSTSI